jgi:TolB-like protein/Tfp pilus assembly protein PilF
MGLVSELRRRNVFRMAVLYVVAAWLIMQVAGVLMDLGALPAAIGPWVLVVLVIGFPIALVFSWLFEITPEGLALEKDVPEGASITHITGRRLDFIIISLLSAAVLLFAWHTWWTEPPPERSVAVLPFENLSADGNQQYFADGIHDALLTRLSRIAGLKVVSRTSVMRYRGSEKTVAEIARELSVTYVVEGSMQRSGNQVRVNVQLIHAPTDEHIWAQLYDRALTPSNIFAMQSGIVETIAKRLDNELSSQMIEEFSVVPTSSLEAYSAYLEANSKRRIESIESLRVAVTSYKKALELDPQFAEAYIGLASAYLMLGSDFYFHGGMPVEESNALSEPLILRALTLDNNLSEAHAALGLLRQQQGKEEAAEKAYRRAIELQPSNSEVFRRFGVLRWRQGQVQPGLELLKKALDLDPYSAPVNYDIGRLYDQIGHFDQALESYLRVIEIEPDHAYAYVYVGALNYLVFGRIDEALVWYQRAAAHDSLSSNLQAVQALPYLEIGDLDRAEVWIELGLSLNENAYYTNLANLMFHVRRDQTAQAVQIARRVLENYPRDWAALNILCNADIANNRYAVAKARYEREFRELTIQENPEIDGNNYAAAVDFAHILLRIGEKERAHKLLDASLEYIASLPRLGVHGYYITDVRVLALQNRTQEALDALRVAADDGWRFLVWYFMNHDPILDPLKSEQSFKDIYAEIEADLSAQANVVRALIDSGELASTPNRY